MKIIVLGHVNYNNLNLIIKKILKVKNEILSNFPWGRLDKNQINYEWLLIDKRNRNIRDRYKRDK